jgi:hypothetical protein
MILWAKAILSWFSTGVYPTFDEMKDFKVSMFNMRGILFNMFQEV